MCISNANNVATKNLKLFLDAGAGPLAVLVCHWPSLPAAAVKVRCYEPPSNRRGGFCSQALRRHFTVRHGLDPVAYRADPLSRNAIRGRVTA